MSGLKCAYNLTGIINSARLRRAGSWNIDCRNAAPKGPGDVTLLMLVRNPPSFTLANVPGPCRKPRYQPTMSPWLLIPVAKASVESAGEVGATPNPVLKVPSL
jgi:hypothetical protein